MRNNKFKLTAVMTLFLIGSQANAVILHACEPADSIIARADDEVCDYYVEAAETCFERLNERYSLLAARAAKTPPKDILSEAEPIKETYEAAIPVVKSYMDKMKPDKGACGDQIEKVGVMLNELKIDLKSVNKHISAAKAKLPR